MRWRQQRPDSIATLVICVLALLTYTGQSAHSCTEGETRSCELQAGVCAGAEQTCVDGEWSECYYGYEYEVAETFCDGLDNDCDGLVDEVDMDGDGVGACKGLPGIVNELLITNLDHDGGTIKVFEYRNGTYEEAWSTNTSDVTETRGGGEAGDLTGDGIPEIALTRGTSSGIRLEIWTLNLATYDWYRLWESLPSAYPNYGMVGDIADVDNDDVNELLVTNGGNGKLELYSWDGDGFSVEATVRDCGQIGAYFGATSGDLDDDGTPEIFYQCYTPEDLIVQEWDGNGFPVVGSVPVPNTSMNGAPMIIDDIETGDVNRDGLMEAVFCGNSGQGHVLAYRNATYVVEYTSPEPVWDDSPWISSKQFSQTCSIGDMTNDGHGDFLVVNNQGAKVYSHDGNDYYEVWVGSEPTAIPGIGSSFAGDPDNDSFTEFLFPDSVYGAEMLLYENDVAGATTFQETHTFAPLWSKIATALIANLNPLNDTQPVDCDDNDPSVGSCEFYGTDRLRRGGRRMRR